MCFYDVRLIHIIGAYNNNNIYYYYCYMLHLCVIVLELRGRTEKVQTINDSKCNIPS
jgi:hypothetical protein